MTIYSDARRITKVHIEGVMFRAAFCCAALLILSGGVLKADNPKVA